MVHCSNIYRLLAKAQTCLFRPFALNTVQPTFTGKSRTHKSTKGKGKVRESLRKDKAYVHAFGDGTRRSKRGHVRVMKGM